MKVAVIMGGPSREYDVSLATGKAVLKNLDRNKYVTRKILISKKGKWFVAGRPVSCDSGLLGVDAVFNAMHGEFGEDGGAQELFERCGIPYTGAGVKASRLGMDKAASREIFKKHRLKTPEFVLASRRQYRDSVRGVISAVLKTLGNGPWIVKPVTCGSSVGVSLVSGEKELKRAIAGALRFSRKIFVEEYLRGMEITAPVLELKSGRAVALPIIEICPRNGNFFDYREKYSRGGAEEIVPARISPELKKRIARAAVVAHSALGCRGYSRIDMIIRDGTPHILELNTLPGLTSASLFPKSAKAAGIDFPKLLDILIANALKK